MKKQSENTVKAKKSVKLTDDELKTINEILNNDAYTSTEIAIAFGIGREVLYRAAKIGSASERTVNILRKALNKKSVTKLIPQ